MSQPYVPVKHPYKANVRWALWRWADIPDANDNKRVYLRRLRIIQCPVAAIYLHWIYLPDEDRDPHDHPFTFWSLILRGGYTEQLYRTHPGVDRDLFPYRRRWLQWSFHKMDRKHAHMITELEPNTISLVFVGGRKGEWGFYTPTYVSSKVYK